MEEIKNIIRKKGHLLLKIQMIVGKIEDKKGLHVSIEERRQKIKRTTIWPKSKEE